ncbi:Wall-associated receptor kinase-like 2 [Striga hermonthica]|uniref:Wall-associated receptor kinase-like 2 n=1 Tax=Striga hermonthica TaxID=68872 RepID=A0A9N7NZQ8_STRHE|nr:Wall-associated receptor kinase-like 2 [Striga hermonthica]
MVLAVSMSRPGCPEKCGNVTIPYPFGVGVGCYANSSFAVVCRNTTNTYRTFLRSINMEVLNISVLGTVIVNHPVSPLNCSSEPRIQNLTTSLVGSPFTISMDHNSLAVLGCQTSVWLRANATTTIGGCMAICDPNSTSASCNGVNCCQTTIPDGLQRLQFTYQNMGSSSSHNNSFCGYVLAVEKKWFQEGYKWYNSLQGGLSNPSNQEFESAPLVLDWEFKFVFHRSTLCYKGRCARSSNHLNYDGDYLNYGEYLNYDGDYYDRDCYFARRSYNSHKDNYLPSGLYCYCRNGYPYFSEGCVDIDECNATNNACQYANGTCINEIGSYNCIYEMKNIKSRLKIAFISIGSVLGALIFLVALWKSGKAIRKLIKASRRYMFYKRNGGLLLEQQLCLSDKSGVDRTKLFSAKELAQATDRYNENRILGGGGQGTVYKGMLTDGRIVAVKKSKRVDEDDLDVFINEVVILSQINHRNIVKLLGCCLETEVPLLVYEFIPNGTLFQHIHDPIEEFPFSWEIRLRVAREIAGALSYLHSDTSPPIYHRDIKSTNILLDDKYRAKVSDFGTSRSVAIDQTHLTTRVLGTFGYLDPEYFQSSQFTAKSDVYSFGVVMVELLTGEKAISSVRVRADEGKSLATHFLQTMEENSLFEILDPRVLNEGNKDEIMLVAQLARRCLHLNGRRRPTMKEIAVELQGIQAPKEGPMFPQNEFEIPESYDFSSFTESTRILEGSTQCSLVDHLPLLDEP